MVRHVVVTSYRRRHFVLSVENNIRRDVTHLPEEPLSGRRIFQWEEIELWFSFPSTTAKKTTQLETSVNMEEEFTADKTAQPVGESGNRPIAGFSGTDYRGDESRPMMRGRESYYELESEICRKDCIGANPEGPGFCALVLTVLSVVLIVLTFPFSVCCCFKVVQEYERAVIFRLGRLMKGGAKGPGIFFIIPCIDTYRKVDLRTVSFDVPPQEVLSKDSVTVAVDAVVYYRISNATIAISNVADYGHSTRLLAATTLRNILGTRNLSEMLSERENISHLIMSILDDATDAWGVKVERVEIKDVRLPVQLQRAMAAEAEAAREARAKVIAAEGEQRAARALKEAADIMAESPSAIQLRYLQTLSTISAEKNSTIIFPIPMDLISQFLPKNRL